jgi:two-component system chemotaxis response regulator CheB
MIVIGASSGGLRAMQTLLSGLPATFPASVAVVFHRHKDADDSLQPALQRCSAIPLTEAVDKELIQPGHIYIAPPDYHLLVEQASLSLSIDEPVLFARPSIDVLFESAADVFGNAAIGVILTGASRDGANGATQIQQRGGMVIVQDPATAEYPTMPEAALAATKTSLVRPLNQIAATLIQLIGQASRRNS